MRCIELRGSNPRHIIRRRAIGGPRAPPGGHQRPRCYHQRGPVPAPPFLCASGGGCPEPPVSIPWGTKWSHSINGGICELASMFHKLEPSNCTCPPLPPKTHPWAKPNLAPGTGSPVARPASACAAGSHIACSESLLSEEPSHRTGMGRTVQRIHTAPGDSNFRSLVAPRFSRFWRFLHLFPGRKKLPGFMYDLRVK